MDSFVPLAPLIAALVSGFLLGMAAAWMLRIMHARSARDIAEELFRESEAERKDQVDEVVGHVRDVFGSLSLDALSKSTEEFLKLAQSRLQADREMGSQDLDRKKGLIDRQLEEMTGKLEAVSSLVRDLEKDRAAKFGELADRLRDVSEKTADLTQTTGTLREALSSSRVRGQWGERMAEDVLRIAGFIEGINYNKQKTLADSGTRPDFTFLLPKGLTLNMDVKFPYDNYVAWLEAPNDSDRGRFCKAFLRDVRIKIKEVASRNYIDPGQSTVDYALLFIPNDQIYAFIHEQEPTILDEGLRQRVIFCSPVTLYAVLAVIRQAVDNFSLEQTSNEILGLFGVFKKQWEEFLKKLEHLGKQIEGAHDNYEALISTRRRRLDKPLERIEEIRNLRNIEITPMEETRKDLPEGVFDGEASQE